MKLNEFNMDWLLEKIEYRTKSTIKNWQALQEGEGLRLIIYQGVEDGSFQNFRDCFKNIANNYDNNTLECTINIDDMEYIYVM